MEKYRNVEMKNCTEVLSAETISVSNRPDISFDSDENVFCLNPSHAETNMFYDGIGGNTSSVSVIFQICSEVN